MKIEDITPQEFSGHRDFENRIKLKVFSVANKSTAGFVYFDKGWLWSAPIEWSSINASA